MNPEFLDRSITHNKSFSVNHAKDRHFLKVFHFHEQVEIVATVKSTGTRYVGDNISRFEPGEIVIIGSNLPHMWQNDDSYFESDTNDAEAVAIHLGTQFLNSGFLQLPENEGIKKLLKQSERGFLVKGNSEIFSRVVQLSESSGYKTFLNLLCVLNDLGQSDGKVLSGEGFSESITQEEQNRMYRVHTLIMNNFTKGITLQKAAEVAQMNASSFSRYFKKKQGIAFVQYVNKVRLGYACKLLMEEQLSILQVCYSSGFNNLSNFNRQFKAMYEMTPRAYRSKFDFTNT